MTAPRRPALSHHGSRHAPPRTPGRATGPGTAAQETPGTGTGHDRPDVGSTSPGETTSSEPVLQARSLTRSYSTDHSRRRGRRGRRRGTDGKGHGQSSGSPVLEGLDLSVKRGQLVAVMGPSGSGKSTLLHCLSGMDRPSSGSVLLEGTDLTTLAEPDLAALRLSRLGLVFQQPHLLTTLCLLDNVILPGLVAGSRPRRDVVARGHELMRQAGIAELADSAVTEVSGGELQRAGICRALINDPDIVFADEPTGALNSVTAAQVLDVLAEIHASGTTMVIVTHDAAVAARADRVLLLVDGTIVEDLSLGRYRQAETSSRLATVSQALGRHSV